MSLLDGDIMEEKATYLLVVKQKVHHIAMVFLATPNEPHPPGVPPCRCRVERCPLVCALLTRA